jgi:hypothetical protein
VASSPTLAAPAVWVAADTGHLPLTSTSTTIIACAAEHHFQLFASANSFVYLASSAATSRCRVCHVGDGGVSQAERFHFIALPFELGGVVVVVISQPAQTNNQADNHGTDNGG